MTNQAIIELLLSVPFNDDYKTIPEIRKQLTTEEFFTKCFVKPANDIYLENSLKNNGDASELSVFEKEILKEDIRKLLTEQSDEIEALYAWIESHQPDLYCFLGDAGTGKSTFLHYLKYIKQSENTEIEIIDIQKVTQEIKILNQIFQLPEFRSLYAKSSAALIKYIIDEIFICNEDENKTINISLSVHTISKLKNIYLGIFENLFPRKEVEDFFDIPDIQTKDLSMSCKIYGNYFFNYFTKLFDSMPIKNAFSILLEIYIHLLICKGDKKHHIIAFDNFERFIGVQEIHNKQLTDFVSDLRAIQNNISNNNMYLLYRFQLIICMRHASVRLFTSEQVTEFMPHTVDINQWFDPSSVLKNKIDWLKKHGVDIAGIRHLPAILEDMGECNNTLRGLHFKINMLFNYNKRVIVTFLVNILRPKEFEINKCKYINDYDYYWNTNNDIPKNLSKFAARSIIYRQVLDMLRDDNFFKCIIVQEDKNSKKNNTVTGNSSTNSKKRLGFARKILTLLYTYDTTRVQRENTKYMKLSDLFNGLFPNAENPLKMLFDINNSSTLNNIVQILFYMNYYNPKEKNWLQFIDIQLDIGDNISETLAIDDYIKLKKLILNNYDKINIRITNAGKAYMYFVVYHFEYFACRSIDEKGSELPPLLCTIPTVEEIDNLPTENIFCISIIKKVQTAALLCISKMNEDENALDFYNDGMYISHSQRIVNSHRGYLDNFIDCIKHKYIEDLNWKMIAVRNSQMLSMPLLK